MRVRIPDYERNRILVKFARKKASRAHLNQKTGLSTLISNNFPKTYGLFGILDIRNLFPVLHSAPSAVAILTSLSFLILVIEPVSAVAVSTIFFHFPVTILMIIGGAIILVSMVPVINRENKRS
ncbi:MAG: hypothetical protein QXQ46_10915 [Thermoplasmatales archaeon]